MAFKSRRIIRSSSCALLQDDDDRIMRSYPATFERHTQTTLKYKQLYISASLWGLAPKIDNKTMCWRENKQLSAAPASRRLGRAGLEAPPLRGRKILSF